MMRALLLLSLWVSLSRAAFTEFYCDAATGSNINAGDNKTVTTATNGDWGNALANRFTAASGTPFSAVAVGDWASVYTDGATVGVYVARVTAVNAGGASLDLSSTAKSGTAPTTAATGRSCTVGGKWKGPNGASAFPVGFVQSTMMNASSHPVRINFKSGTTYAITAGMSTTNAGPIFWQGYTTTPGDLGKATIDGGTSGASYTLLTANVVNHSWTDFIFANNGATGAADGIVNSAAENVYNRVVVHDIRRTGIGATTGIQSYCEVEAYACNKSNTSSACGMYILISGTAAIRCHSHDHTAGANANGLKVDGGIVVFRCISESNTGNGSFSTGDVTQTQYQSEYYNNSLSGMLLSNSANMLFNIQNCNYFKNGRWAVENGATFAYNGIRYNAAFGTGSQANTLGDIEDMEGMEVVGTINHASGVTPWVDPANGDFRINLAAAKGAGRGRFTQTSSGYSGTISYPDVGAAQHTP